MKKPYFTRVYEQTPTRFWINNPTREHAQLAIANSAQGCTCNPSYCQKMLDHPKESAYAWKVLDEVLKETGDDTQAQVLLQRRLVTPIAGQFMPIFERTQGREGHVSIQGDPVDDHHADYIISQALENNKTAPNIACKIPVISAGLKAIEALVPENVVINATEIFATSQAIALCETYEKASRQSGKRPVIYLSHIAGIYDDHFRNYVEQEKIDISPDVLYQAGLAVARKVYGILRERGYSAVFIGGGARGLHHFTEMVGGELIVTINWEGTADKLIEQDPPVMYRLFNPVPQRVIAELMEKLPDFRRGWLEDGLLPEEFEDFGAVQLFRDSFLKSWYRVLDLIKERRAQS
ncbi:MAG: hypothetical protein HPY76_00405 [Anaerolineae bacterium]|nr:hypothetical protein [Anaerolineae bacterium]